MLSIVYAYKIVKYLSVVCRECCCDAKNLANFMLLYLTCHRHATLILLQKKNILLQRLLWAGVVLNRWKHPKQDDTREVESEKWFMLFRITKHKQQDIVITLNSFSIWNTAIQGW